MLMSCFISLVFCSSPLVKEVFFTFDVEYFQSYFLDGSILSFKFSFGFILSLVFVHVLFSCFDLLFLLVLEVMLS